MKLLTINDILIANSGEAQAAIWGINKWWTYVPDGSILILFFIKLPPFIWIFDN